MEELNQQAQVKIELKSKERQIAKSKVALVEKKKELEVSV
jgi:hypothetical protein